MTKRPNLILDLDETLINSEEVKYFDRQRQKEKMRLFKWHKMDNDFYVFERPNLQKFLDFVFENFDVSIWTAASKNYALWIIHRILKAGTKKRPLQHIFFDYHCKASENLGTGKKDLKILSENFNLREYDMANTIIMDDNREIYEVQPNNTVSIKEFQYKDKNSNRDNELYNTMLILTEILKIV